MKGLLMISKKIDKNFKLKSLTFNKKSTSLEKSKF
jgi:hypothetical protein